MKVVKPTWVEFTAIPNPDKWDESGKPIAVQASCVISIGTGRIRQMGTPEPKAGEKISQIAPREMETTVLMMLDGTQLAVQEPFDQVVARLRENVDAC